MLRILQRNKIFRKLFCLEMWNIGRTQSIERSLEYGKWVDVEWLDPENSFVFYADPCAVLKIGQSSRLLFEKLDIRDNKGIISSVDECHFGLPNRINQELIDPDYHLSYPTVLTTIGQSATLIPEKAESGNLDSYSYENEHWIKKDAVLHGISALDPTFYRDGEYLYLFFTDAGDGPNSKLQIKFKKLSSSTWEDHPMSPIEVGPYGARPAGPIFCRDGVLYRPGQDNVRGYGEAIVVFKITALNLNEYSESFAYQIAPPDAPYDKGTHTILITDQYAYLDAKRLDFNAFAFLFKLRNIIKQR